MIFNEAYFRLKGTRSSLKTCTPWQIKLLTVRLCIAYPSWLMLYFAVSILPVGLNQVIQNLIPFTTLLLSYLALKETLKPLEIVNMGVSFAGVIFIVMTSNKMRNHTDGNEASGIFYLAVLSNLGMVIIGSVLNVILRSLKDVH